MMNIITLILTWIKAHPDAMGLMAAIAYDLIVRAIPTAKNWGIWDNISKLFNILVPNKKVDGGVH